MIVGGNAPVWQIPYAIRPAEARGAAEAARVRAVRYLRFMVVGEEYGGERFIYAVANTLFGQR